MRSFQKLSVLGLFPALLYTAPRCEAKPEGELHVEVIDAESGDFVPARVHLLNRRGRSVRSRGWGHAPLGDHAYLEGTATFELRRGAYRFDLDAGVEYRTLAGHFEIERDADDSKRIEVHRFADLAQEGWIGADLATLRPAKDHDLLRRAEQLGHLTTARWQWEGKQWKPTPLKPTKTPPQPSCALWDDPRGLVWLHDPTGELSAEDLPTEGTSSVAFLRAARQSGWQVVVSPTSQELPLWLAQDLVDAVLVIDGWSDSKVGASATRRSHRPTERRFAGRGGEGKWREHVYHQTLEAGLRLPAVAASGSGMNESPVGMARVYAYAPGKGSPTAWWEQVASGATVVTNGPLLRPMFEGRPPGTEFDLPRDGKLELRVTLNLATREPVDYLEILQNGKVVHSVRLIDWAKSGGELPHVMFDTPGWLLVRAVTNASDHYQFASSGPCFVGEVGERTEPSAIRFFLDWLHASDEQFGESDPEAYAVAERFWQAKLDQNP